MRIKLLAILAFVLIVATSVAFALNSNLISDNGSISGFVSDDTTKETLIGATVVLEGTKHGAITNKNGFFTINNVPPGRYKIVVSFIGYDKFTDTINLTKQGVVRKNIFLKASTLQTEEVSVEAEREIERREITISKVNVPVQQIRKIRIGGESDLFRSLQYLPGILTSSQISSGLYVRGGSPDQNLVLLDNMTVYNPSHLFGFISTFNTDAIKDVELVKGGFPAEFGGRISSVLNITQNEGNRQKIGGNAGIGLISSKALLEGPLFNGSWFIGARRTYIDILKNFIPEDPTLPLPNFWFYDINAKITQEFGSSNKAYLSGFQSKDLLEYKGFGIDFHISIMNQAIATRWIHILADNIFTSTGLSYNYYRNEFIGDASGYIFKIQNSIGDINFKTNVDWTLSELINLKFGYELSKFNFKYIQNFSGTETDTAKDSGVTPAGILNLSVEDWNHSIYAQSNYNFSDFLSFQAGIRANYWSLSNTFSADPRFAVRYRLNQDMALKFAWGIYHQNIRLATQPDFSFFDTWLPTDTTIPSVSSNHYVLSLETEPLESINLNFDIYYKTLRNISELNTNVLQTNNARDVFYIGNGRSYGAEIFFQKKYGRFVGWFGYALGFVYARFDSINAGREFRPKYDRRHDLKIVAQYILSKRWEFSATFVFQSGQSYTGATSVLLTRLPEQNAGRGKIIPSQRYGLRLPASHQLNLSVIYNFTTFGLPSKLILDIYNVYSRRDIWFRYYDTRGSLPKVEDVRLLPIIPTLSYEIKF